MMNKDLLVKPEDGIRELQGLLEREPLPLILQ